MNIDDLIRAKIQAEGYLLTELDLEADTGVTIRSVTIEHDDEGRVSDVSIEIDIPERDE